MEAIKHQLPIQSLVNLLNTERKTTSIVTIRSNKTEKDFTYKIIRKLNPANNKFYTFIYVENGYMQFKYVGFYNGQEIINKNKSTDTPAAKGIV